MLRLEANGSTGGGVVAVRGSISKELWVRWADAGGARLLPIPFPQRSQQGRAPALFPAPMWPLMSSQAEEASYLRHARFSPKYTQNGKEGRRSVETTRQRSADFFDPLENLAKIRF